MKIGIIGCGVVGEATAFGMEKAGNEVIRHDPKLGTSIDIVADCLLKYICVPTPSREDGECDISIVESVVESIWQQKNKATAITILKSTAPPGTCDYLSEKYQLPIYFVPEFLRERCAITDFVENHKLLAVGWPECERHSIIASRTLYNTDKSPAIKAIIDSHGKYPKTVQIMRSREAELLKYFHNTINALRITIANEFYDIAQEIKGDYTTVKNALLLLIYQIYIWTLMIMLGGIVVSALIKTYPLSENSLKL